jgi:uncharacterized protein (TIGR02145 family)
LNDLSSNTFIDARDGKEYPYVTIGTQVWMAKNLDYDTADGTGSWCYENSASNCITYGRLYDWETAMAVCPEGWHLPSHAEWSLITGTSTSSGTQGKELKANSSLWETNTGTDIYGFSILPGGSYSGDYDGSSYSEGYWGSLGSCASIWTATEYSPTQSHYRSICGERDYIYYNESGWSKASRYSVRCVMD